ncbi:hypothetical protein bcgnr5378_07040 [Bacillus cereus]|uniref:LRAT domain-containing protein n=1 Tax=Bacillus cereus TaxID=1396 RepID=A0A164NX98_BACCE|nr:lecithin retinol acyltransferase family protein [Bacillus cereus]KZD65960.1 hypothetical protein B4088_2717 [Bacillus cereus]HDR8323530.1 hypothetical protein [Bacillus cereus]HDR8329472.1 hypothetical protein [Bacillus cereus]HDR8337558.1 hypothetical protein [Bacillus cereus]
MWNTVLNLLLRTGKTPPGGMGGPDPTKDLFNAVLAAKQKEFNERNPGNQEPAVGSMVYCMLGPVEHSGIYIGQGYIAHLNGNGEIEVVSPKRFTDHVTTLNTDIFIPMDNDDYPIGDSEIAFRAIEMVGEERNYNFLMDNCHQFSAGCITGDFENASNFLFLVKHDFSKTMEQDSRWGRWKWEEEPYPFRCYKTSFW